jgi:hypothetical protein
VPERPLSELRASRYREKASGREFNAVRVDGWIVWDLEGPNLVDSDEFEADYEPAEPGTPH